MGISLDEADIIIMFIDGKTLSPITLLELGLYMQKQKASCNMKKISGEKKCRYCM
jgi:nucleoside 2-deoxyribosyltransferase